jgi:hypothetical protein
LFVIFVAEIAYVSRTFENPLFAEEMNILDFLRQVSDGAGMVGGFKGGVLEGREDWSSFA